MIMEWESVLPPHLSLPRSVAAELENFRESIGCPEEVFGMRILGSAWATSKTQKLTYEKVRSENPGASEVELVNTVYETRKLTSIMAGQELPPLPRSCKTFGALVEFIVREEARHAMPDPFGWGAAIDSILAKVVP